MSRFKSYVTGFILSLIFTFVPYYLVVNKVATGNAILSIILVFALLQMGVQLVFFLHLGWAPKMRWNLFFFVSTYGMILFITVASIWIMAHLHHNMAPAEVQQKLVDDEAIAQIGGEKTGACHDTGDNHRVLISSGKSYPTVTAAKRCDTLTIINEDEVSRDVSFGTKGANQPYAGVWDLSLSGGRGKTITLSEAGSFHFYDHLHPDTSASFTVSK
jgi:cytochrome o ubiquinol oxidase operon protein cyoD